MTHHHDHQGHHDHHDHSSEQSMAFPDKMIKLFEHWIKHNDDHADSYRNWADQARNHGFTDVATLIENAAQKTDELTEVFKEAHRLLK